MLKARGYKVIVEPDPVQKKSAGGIIISSDAEEKMEKTGIQRGVIVSMGPSAYKAFREVDENGTEHNGEPWAKEGDYVLFARHAGRFIFDPFEPAGSNEYLIMNDEDILAVISEGHNEVPLNEVRAKVIETY